MKKLIFPFDVYESIRQTIGTLPSETGGLLGGDLSGEFITHFRFDQNGKCSQTEYSPDIETLNSILNEWNARNIRLRGQIHSHPDGLNAPSGGDDMYAAQILAANPELPELVVPIVQPTRGEKPFQIFGFVATRKGARTTFERVPVYVQRPAPTKTETSRLRPIHRIRACMNNFFAAKRLSWERSFLSRVVDAYDIIALRKWHVIGIGIGGAAGVHEDLVRAGVTKITLIDPGSVETCNLATQAYYRSDIGRLKVECLAKRLRRINPYVEVAECSVRLDEIDDARFEQFAFRPFVLSTKPENVLIIGATDDFFAQSRVNRLGLHFGFPTVACQMYDQALAGEVMFFHQQTTPACLRCISSSRHRAYLNGYRNSVGSNGSPITSTTRLNALTATIGLAIMHHGTGHPRWGSLLDQLGDRNLVQVRCHPATAQRLGLPNFDQAFHGASNAQLFCDETIWRPQKPEHPASGYDVPCPECGGTGDLIKAKGTFPDTRLIPI